MAATARQIPLTGEDLESTGAGAYAELEVPGDYEAVLVDVQDYDKRAAGKSFGWIFIYDVETPNGSKVQFKSYLSFGPNARWKLVEYLSAHDVDLEEGLNSVDPNALIGDMIGAHIDFPRDENDVPTSKYREIRQAFSLAEEPEVTEVVETNPVLEVVAANAEAVRTHDPEADGPKFGETPDII